MTRVYILLQAEIVAIFASSSPAATGWTHNGTAIAVGPDDQFVPKLVPDASGGTIITWTDRRNGANDIYAQRVDGFGNSLWAPGGVPVCTADSVQAWPEIVPDGESGAIITWHDQRNGSPGIYAQRLDASGVALWTVHGVAVSADSSAKWYPRITTDGSGGAIVAWRDQRNDDADIYAQRLNARG